jgi:hypothetical protein
MLAGPPSARRASTVTPGETNACSAAWRSVGPM